MKYRFSCGGINWECVVDIELTDEEANAIRSTGEETLSSESEVYDRVYNAILDQCEDDSDIGDFIVWLPKELRGDL